MNTRTNRREAAERIEQQARALRSRTLRRLAAIVIDALLGPVGVPPGRRAA